MDLQKTWIFVIMGCLMLGIGLNLYASNASNAQNAPRTTISPVKSLPPAPAVFVTPITMPLAPVRPSAPLVHSVMLPALSARAPETVLRLMPRRVNIPRALDRPYADPAQAFDIAGLKSVELMQAVAEENQGPTQSRLDLILEALANGPKVISPDANNADAPAPDSDQPLLVAAADAQPRPLPEAARLSATRPKARSIPVEPATLVRPVSKPDKRARPSFSAQHFHNLRYHGAQTVASDVPCVAEMQLIAARTHIYFASGSSDLSETGKSAARLMAAKAQSCPEADVSIIGFTDPGGPADVNLKLSWLRANAVFRSIEGAGFATKRIEVSSHMEDHPEECLHYEGVDRRVIFAVKDVARN